MTQRIWSSESSWRSRLVVMTSTASKGSLIGPSWQDADRPRHHPESSARGNFDLLVDLAPGPADRGGAASTYWSIVPRASGSPAAKEAGSSREVKAKPPIIRRKNGKAAA